MADTKQYVTQEQEKGSVMLTKDKMCLSIDRFLVGQKRIRSVDIVQIMIVVQ